MLDLKSMTENEIAEALSETGAPRYRAAQVYKWAQRGVSDFEDMTDLPKAFREKLGELFYLSSLKLRQKQVSADGTEKYLWELSDGNTVESVVMRYKHGNSVCLSTQVGCRMGCAFCASTRGGRVRDLTAGEMLDEVRYSQKECGERISNIVLMGIGEPLDNFDAVMRFLELAGDPAGVAVGMRHISLSTCGPEGGIKKLMEKSLQLTLSVSLHAADDATRSRLMPVNNATGGIDRLMKDCRAYFLKTGRRVSFEYLLAKGINDSDEQAEMLADRLRGSGAHVNLIPLNRTPDSVLEPSDPARVKRFKSILEEKGVTVTVRRRLGSDIDAACGQLRRAATRKI